MWYTKQPQYNLYSEECVHGLRQFKWVTLAQIHGRGWNFPGATTANQHMLTPISFFAQTSVTDHMYGALILLSISPSIRFTKDTTKQLWLICGSRVTYSSNKVETEVFRFSKKRNHRENKLQRRDFQTSTIFNVSFLQFYFYIVDI